MIHVKKEKKKNTKYASHLYGYLYKSWFHGRLSLFAPDWGCENSVQMNSQNVRAQKILSLIAKSAQMQCAC